MEALGFFIAVMSFILAGAFMILVGIAEDIEAARDARPR